MLYSLESVSYDYVDTCRDIKLSDVLQLLIAFAFGASEGMPCQLDCASIADIPPH